LGQDETFKCRSWYDVIIMERSDILELLAEAPYGAYAIDMNQKIVFWNKGAERILGYSASDVLGRGCYQLLGGKTEDRSGCESNCNVIVWARSGRIAPSHTICTQSKDGQLKWIGITHVLLPAAKRELSTLVHIFYDASEAVQAKRLLGQLRDMLSAAPAATRPSHAPIPSRDIPFDNLTAREREVLGLLSQGLGTRDIAQELKISPATTRNHIQRILSKLEVESRLQAVAAAARRSLL
jgi:PAS domain S-box-containing protein